MKAAIDIGTNTVLLLVAEMNADEIVAIYEEQRIPRLGKGVDENRRIDEPAIQRIADVLLEYKQLIIERFPQTDSIIVTATSAVRDAQNRDEFLQEIKKKTGLEIRLLSGGEEAEWTTAGALSVLPDNFRKNAVILDIGGGSTEVAHIVDGNLRNSHSFDMGSVRFTEKFLKNNPPLIDEIEACRNEIRRYFKTQTFQFQGTVQAVGVAGTLTSLASILMNSDEYEPEIINGFEITKSGLAEFIEFYRTRTHEEMLLKYPGLLKGRSDVFLAGLLILDEFLSIHKLEQITVSVGGIRHGALIQNKKGDN